MPPESLLHAVAALCADGVAEERWFGGKGSEIGPVRLAGSLGPFDDDWLLALDLGGAAYLVPAALTGARIAPAAGPVWRALAAACIDGSTLAGDRLTLHCTPGPAPAAALGPAVRPLGVDQSNTSVVIGERLVLKCYRRLTSGPHPELELTRYLSARGLTCVPAVHGSATVELADGSEAGALLLQEFVADGRNGWLAAEAELGSLLDAGAADAAARAPEAWAAGIGCATADLHALLARAHGPRLAPRQATGTGLELLRAAADAQLDEALALLDGAARAELEAAAPALRTRFAVFASAATRRPPLLTRVHGDLHLGQFLLRDGGEPALVDFEGEPTKDAAERSNLSSPLRDLGGLLRSVEHAAQWVCLTRSELAGPVASAWIAAARGAVRGAYERRLAELRAPLRVDPELLDAFEAEKAVYEFVYAARFLPSWLEVPRRALPSVLGA